MNDRQELLSHLMAELAGLLEDIHTDAVASMSPALPDAFAKISSDVEKAGHIAQAAETLARNVSPDF